MKKISILMLAFGICLSLKAVPPLATFKTLVALGDKDGASALFAAFDKDVNNAFTKQAVAKFKDKFGEQPKATTTAEQPKSWTATDTKTMKFKKLFSAGGVDAFGSQVLKNAVDAKEITEAEAKTVRDAISNLPEKKA